MENIENIEKIDVHSVKDLIDRLSELEQENKELHKTIFRQERMIKGLRLNNSSLTLERNQICEKLHEIQQLSMFEFGNRYCTSESLEADGHRFARELLGKPMSESDIAAEEHEAELVSAMGSYLGDDY